MVNLNWPEQQKGKRVAEVSPKISRRVTKEANHKSKATISAGVVKCSRGKCEILASSRDTARHRNYQRLAQHIRKVPPEVSSAKKEKNPETDSQAKNQLEELTKIEFPSELSIHPASPSINQLEPSQSQVQYEPIPAKDDRTGLLETGEQEDWTEEYGEEQMEYDGELDEETQVFGAELESLLQGDLGINMMFILPEKFKAIEGQESTLEGDVLSQETFECRLVEVEEAPE
ncbi:unnamed protein product [Prunus armeniaca]